MRLIDAGITAFTDDPRFTGSVSGASLAPDEDPQLHAYVVSFEAGGRTVWHAHERGQLLICTAGQGYVGVRGGRTVELCAGAAVWTDAGEEHWHGAQHDAAMTHVAVHTQTHGADAVQWQEAVTPSDLPDQQGTRR